MRIAPVAMHPSRNETRPAMRNKPSHGRSSTIVETPDDRRTPKRQAVSVACKWEAEIKALLANARCHDLASVAIRDNMSLRVCKYILQDLPYMGKAATFLTHLSATVNTSELVGHDVYALLTGMHFFALLRGLDKVDLFRLIHKIHGESRDKCKALEWYVKANKQHAKITIVEYFERLIGGAYDEDEWKLVFEFAEHCARTRFASSIRDVLANLVNPSEQATRVREAFMSVYTKRNPSSA